jgi:hypothetical protein
LFAFTLSDPELSLQLYTDEGDFVSNFMSWNASSGATTVFGPFSASGITDSALTGSGVVIQSDGLLASSTTLTGLTSVTSAAFVGALTGHASLDLALTGGTVTGATTFSAGITSTALISDGSPPTLSGTCSVGTQTGGNTAGTFKAAGPCSTETVVLTFATTAPTGWVCGAHDQTTPADSMNQTASTATTCTLTGTIASGDVIAFDARAF